MDSEDIEEEKRRNSSFKYCSECNNLLYPREDRSNSDVRTRKLLYACRNCDYQEDAVNQRVYRNDISSVAIEPASKVHDLSADPALPRTRMSCKKCGNAEAVFFQSQAAGTDKMTLFYVCAKKECDNRWESH